MALCVLGLQLTDLFSLSISPPIILLTSQLIVQAVNVQKSKKGHCNFSEAVIFQIASLV